MEQDAVNHIGALAVEAMLHEVAATPKPGLVDRLDSGAHDDMDFFTFLSSAAALGGTFGEMAHLGVRLRKSTPENTFAALQRCGLEGERRMYAATQNVNTHKGMIFSLGLVCGAAGRILGTRPLTRESLSQEVQDLCRGLCRGSFSLLECRAALSNGERLYLEHGITGVRGEAEAGYPTVLAFGYPVYQSLRREGHPLNTCLVQTLLHLIANTADTNIIARLGMGEARYARAFAGQVIAAGGMLTDQGRERLEEMNRQFIRRRISPGGSADLLAVTSLFYALENSGL